MPGAAIAGRDRQSPHAWAVGNRSSSTRLIRTLRLASGQPSLIILVERQPDLSSPPLDEPLTVSPRWVVPVSSTWRAPMPMTIGDRSYLVLAMSNVIMNECAVKCTLIEWR